MMTVLVVICEEFIFSRLRIFGIAPVAGGALTAVIAMFEGSIPGALYGAAVGYMQYGVSGGAEGLIAFVYLVVGFFISITCEYLFHRRFLTALIWSAALTTTATLMYYIVFMLIPRRATALQLLTVALPEIIYSQIFVPIVYFAVKRIKGYFEE